MRNYIYYSAIQCYLFYHLLQDVECSIDIHFIFWFSRDWLLWCWLQG